MLENLRRKRSQIPKDLYKSVLTRLYAFSPSVSTLNLGKLRLGSQAHKSFRCFGQRGPVSYELCAVKDVSFKMLECPVGTFIMGHADQNGNLPSSEVIETSFLLGQTEVTQELYEAVMGTNPSRFQPSKSDAKIYKTYPFSLKHPVEKVSWLEGVEFCNKLSTLQGLEECYTTRKTRIGILRSKIPSEKKELVRYNRFYESVRSHILDYFKNDNPYNVEFEIEYDPDVSTCDAIVTGGGRYWIKYDWEEKLQDKFSLDLNLYLGDNHYLLNKEAKKKLDAFLKECTIPIILCDFTKNGYRLPTEEEWEYAAKAGTENQWSGTNEKAKLVKYAVYYDTSKNSTEPVGSKSPNEWGFYDMSGNVGEWCWDKYNPKGNTSARRVIRGGGWYYGASDLRFAFRNYASPDSRYDCVGFRVCRTLV